MRDFRKPESTPLAQRLWDSVPVWFWAITVGVVAAMILFARPSQLGFAVTLKEPPVDARWENMVNSITDRTAHYDGDVGIFIKDLRSGRTFEHNSHQRFLSASLIKVPIMAALFLNVESGQFRLDETLRYRRKYRREGSGTLKWARDGRRFTISSLVHSMITKSDNTATAMIIGLIGYDNLNQRFKEIGLKETRIAPTGMSLASRLDPSLDNWTTPREMGKLLEKIYRHQILKSDGLSDLMLEIMKNANSPSRLAKNLPHDWQLARKTGLLRKNCHDVGIVFSPEGDYIICVLTGDNRTYANAKGFISEVGKRTYSYFANNS